ncbi:MAG TPA: helix-turn-helix domain-containing protein [Pyrinomonadaceae bacterium]|jgi:Predicted transcriptional regulators|nr:helix-turn-helix domain-containing protein [Pyrinomonadaceae bacterium]
MIRRDLDGCPITAALQMLGDKWTMLVVRELVAGPKRTMELLADLYPISSRTLLGRVRDMEKDGLIVRSIYGDNSRHIQYALTQKGRLLVPLLESLRELGLALKCNDCEDRMERLGAYCLACPLNQHSPEKMFPERERRPVSTRREQDDSIVLL